MQFLAVAFVGFIGILMGFFFISNISVLSNSFAAPSLYSNLTYESFAKSQGWDIKKGKVLGDTVEVTEFSYPNTTIEAMLPTIPNASRFMELYTASGGASFLVESAPYTLFVPTNTAFDALTYADKVALNTLDGAPLKRFVSHHMVPQRLAGVTGGVKAGTVQAISRDYLNFELRKNGGTVGNAHVVATYTLKNGIIYVIDGVLFPPERMPGL